MPKENTHLYFAHKVMKKIKDPEIKSAVKSKLKFFYFGSVIPDTFYYSGHEEIIKISEYLHGRYGNSTNEMAFKFLDAAREKQSEKDLVFALGFLTHCALDITFHPAVYYFSGNYYDPDKKKADEAIYLHRHLETYLDAEVNKEYYFSNLVDLSIINKLLFDDIIEEQFGIWPKDIKKVLKRKALLLRLLKINSVYKILHLGYDLGLVKHKHLLGLFYGNLLDDSRIFPTELNYRDLITGEPVSTSIDRLFEQAQEYVQQMISIAFDYYNGKISQEEAAKIIRGESLNTGKIGVPVTDIKYFYNN